MNAFRIVLAVVALAAGVFWIAVGLAIVSDGNVYGWGGVLVGAGLAMRGWRIVRSQRLARAERRAREGPQQPTELVWPGGTARGFDWDGDPLPSAAQRVAGVRDHMAPSKD